LVIACVDVDYRESLAVAGCILFRTWTDDSPAGQCTASTVIAAGYRPGQFYLRELPAILAVLSVVSTPLDVVVIDGYVWLGAGKAGLGARLYSALGERTPVVGVAKTKWHSQESLPPAEYRAIGVVRGSSSRPLYVTAAGMSVEVAALHVGQMHGAHRIPTLLKAADRLARSCDVAPAAER
jgi:deoxyribonuclease V